MLGAGYRDCCARHARHWRQAHAVAVTTPMDALAADVKGALEVLGKHQGSISSAVDGGMIGPGATALAYPTSSSSCSATTKPSTRPAQHATGRAQGVVRTRAGCRRLRRQP